MKTFCSTNDSCLTLQLLRGQDKKRDRNIYSYGIFL